MNEEDKRNLTRAGDRLLEALEKVDSSYPHQDGDVLVIGPGVIQSDDGRVINYQGENFYRDGQMHDVDLRVQAMDLSLRLDQSRSALEVANDAVVIEHYLRTGEVPTVKLTPSRQSNSTRNSGADEPPMAQAGPPYLYGSPAPGAKFVDPYAAEDRDKLPPPIWGGGEPVD